MKLKLHYERSTSQPSDIVLTTDTNAEVGQVARELLDADPVPHERTRFGSRVTLSVSPPGGGPKVTVPPERPIGDTAIASGSHISVIDIGSPPHPATHVTGQAAAVLRVVAGPDAPTQHMLKAGTSIIGRDPSVDVVLADDFASKRHARIEVGATIEIVDLNSANGLIVDGGIVTRTVVLPGQEITIGDSRITITPLASGAPVPQAEVRAGAIPFHRSPRVERRYPEREHPRPAVPTAQDSPPFPWLLMAAPVVMGLGLFAMTRNPMSLMFVAMAPLMMLGNFATQRSRNKRQLQADIARFEDQLSVLRATLEAEIPKERATRQAETPPVSEVYQAAFDRNRTLWTRRPEHWTFAHLRLGVSTLRSRNSIAAAAELDNGLPEYTRKIQELEAKFASITDVPVVEDLTLSGALGIVGTSHSAADAVRSYLVQLAGLHSPSELVIVALASPTESADYAWLGWLPHTSSAQSPLVGTHLADSTATASSIAAQLEQVIDQRLGQRAAELQLRGPLKPDLQATATGGTVGQTDESDPTAPPRPLIVVLITEFAPIDRARIVNMSERGAAAGVLPIWATGSAASLPAVCRTYVDVSRGLGDADVHFVRHGETITPVVIEGVSHDHATTFAHALTPLADSGAPTEDSSDLPRQITLLTLLGGDLAQSYEAIVERWNQNQSIIRRDRPAQRRKRTTGLRAIVGQGGIDAMHLDLREQGPHALVGGTTGSGKSEFLQAWVLGMAAEYSPDRVNFLFIDYKGGAGYEVLKTLPHAVGLVTDLDNHLVERAMISLKAELRHREALTKAKGVNDLLELEKKGDHDTPPALILVIDEFAALKMEFPDFVDDVVDLAARGRSLGIHLIMATQRPAGIIGDNLRANTNLRVALRMNDESDSTDVLGAPDAAFVDLEIKGRGFAKSGPGRLAPFQSAYSRGHSVAGGPRPSIVIHPLGFGADTPWEKPDELEADTDESGPTDQERLVASLIRASDHAGIKLPRRPWKDELAPAYDLRAIKNYSDEAIIFGIKDLPEKQDQTWATFRPDIDGNLAIYGTGGSGKTVALRTLACATGHLPRGGPINTYCLDFASGGLKMLEELPNVGAVISGDDNERVERLLRTLRDTADRRSRDFPAEADSIVEYRRITNKPDAPRILVLIDGYRAFRDQWESGAGRAPLFNVFLQLLATGKRLGIHFVFTADSPNTVFGAVASSVPRRVVLRLSDDALYHSLDVKTNVLTPKSPPGRALVDNEETQIAIYGGSSNVADQSEAIRKHAAAIARQGRSEAPGIGALPDMVAFDSLPTGVEGHPVLGIGDETLEPIGFPAEGLFVLGGQTQSGRSNALAAMAHSIRNQDPEAWMVYLGNRRSSVPDALKWDEIAQTPDDVATLAKAITAKIRAGSSDKHVVFVESISDFTSDPAATPLKELSLAVKNSEHMLLAETDTSSWTAANALYIEFKNARRGILLQPDYNEVDQVLKTPGPVVSRFEFPAGRGLFTLGRKVVRVQLPLAP